MQGKPAESGGVLIWILLMVVIAILVAIAVILPRMKEEEDFPGVIGSKENSTPRTQEVEWTPPVDDGRPTRLFMGKSWAEVDDPESDGWDSEAFHDQVTAQLKSLSKLFHSGEPLSESEGEKLVVDGFSCGALVPGNLEVVFSDGTVAVARSDGGSSSASFAGRDGFSGALEEIARIFRGATDLRVKFKVFDIRENAGEDAGEKEGQGSITKQYFSISGRSKKSYIEQKSTWETRWSVSGDLAPKLASIEISDFEQVTTVEGNETLFTDCTTSVLGKNADFEEQFLRGMSEWFERAQDARYFALLGAAGLSVGDVNGDGMDDVFSCQEGGLPNRLFLQNPDGTATDVSKEWGVDWLEASRSALLVDLDQDGDQDLTVALLGNVVVCENLGDRFSVKTVLPTDDDTMTLTAVDFDNDADLDLYVCVDYGKMQVDSARAASLAGGGSGGVYHDANNGGRNCLYRNDLEKGEPFRFTDATDEVGLDKNNRRYSLAASWEDFDNDGDQDLYVGNDFGRNNLYQNLLAETGRATFQDMAATTGAEDSASGMGVSWADFDRDGRMDVHVSNMFSSAGGRITGQKKFKPDASEEVRNRLRRFARGNTLLSNQEGGFSDVSETAGVTMGRWAWGSNFVDLNNDGWKDIVVGNGYITAEDTGDL